MIRARALTLLISTAVAIPSLPLFLACGNGSGNNPSANAPTASLDIPPMGSVASNSAPPPSSAASSASSTTTEEPAPEDTATFGHGAGPGNPPVIQTPTIRQGPVSVNGALPPEVIQRIIRQHYGRFRLCYEMGLGKDPALKGTVSVKVVIGPKGDVTSATDNASPLPNPQVIECIVRGFKNMSFPQPAKGSVTVIYPLIFSPGSP